MEQLDVADVPLRPRLTGCPVPLTAGQLVLWNEILKRGTRPSDLRTCAASLRLFGPLNTLLLKRSIEAVVQRHESLRTTIVPVDSTPRQCIHPSSEYQLEMIDLSQLAPTNVEGRAKLLAQEFIERRIDISIGPLFEAKLLRFSNREHVLILALDHMVSDAVSCAILSREIWALYSQAERGLPFSLPQLPVQFADYAVWQQQAYGDWVKKHASYWRGRLTGAQRIQLPFDDSMPKIKHLTIAMLHFPFGKALSDKLRDMARRERTPLPLLVLTVYAALLSSWCNAGDFVVAVASHGRYRRPELENMIGFLANSPRLRIEVSRKDNFLDLSRRVTQEFHSASDHQGIGLTPDFIPECTTDAHFNWVPNWPQSSANQKGEIDNPIKMQPFPIQPFRGVEAPFKFAPVFCDTAAGVVVTARYRPDLFEARTIERVGHNLRLFAAHFSQRPLTRIAAIHFLS